MIKRSIISYYIFGTQMRYLQDAQEGHPFSGGDGVQENLERFFSNIGKLELEVTQRASRELKKFLKKTLESDTKRLDVDQAKELSKLMTEIRHTLDAEIEAVYAYVTTPKRLDIDKLLDDVSALFSPGTYELFPDIAKYDFNEAGKCIAFERPTAAAFHILRATEANLRHYYKNMIRRKRISSEMWGPIVHDLRARNKTKKFTTLNNHMDNIRLSFRNPTQHPEATYDIHEAQDLLSICIDANNRMFKILESSC